MSEEWIDCGKESGCINRKFIAMAYRERERDTAICIIQCAKHSLGKSTAFNNVRTCSAMTAKGSCRKPQQGRYIDVKTQRHENTQNQRRKDSKTQRSLVTQKHSNSEVQ